MRRGAVVLAAAFAVAAPARGQENAALRSARQAYEELRYADAVAVAGRAIETERLNRSELIEAYRLLGYANAVLDSTAKAVEAFRALILLAPDDEPDVLTVSPRITSLYRLALGQVLVVRQVRVDSTSFVMGQGSLPIRFEVSRAAGVRVRVEGGGGTVVVDSQARAGEVEVRWRAEAGDAEVPAGRYDVIIDAIAGRDQFTASAGFTVAHSSLDTLPHLLALPGYTEQPEFEARERDVTSLGLAAVYAALGVGAVLAIQDRALVRPPAGLVAAAGVTVGTGVWLSLRRPEPRLVPAAVLYNRLLRELLAQRNAEIAQQNAERRRQVRLTLLPILPDQP